MSRVMCYRCFWPADLCWCASITPMATRTRFVLLMHPKEFKHEKAATGRLTHLCLANSLIHSGVSFDDHEAVQALIHDPANAPALLFPGSDALNLSTIPADAPAFTTWRSGLAGRTLTVFILDATWALGKKMLRLSPSLRRLPRIMFTPASPSRYMIKQQPHPSCLSTLESVHELLLVMERTGLDSYPLPDQLLSLFQRMQDYQIRCAADPNRAGYRHRAYRPPADRAPAKGRSGRRRQSLFSSPPE